MPYYDFFCHNCRKHFSKILSLVDYEEEEVLCPHCGSKEVELRWAAITSRKSRLSCGCTKFWQLTLMIGGGNVVSSKTK
jgi:putative FmdB family regulatory protein